MRRTPIVVGLGLSIALTVSGSGAVGARVPIHAALPPVLDDVGRYADDFFRWLAGRGGAIRVTLPTVIGTLDDIALRSRLTRQALGLGLATDDLITLLKWVQRQGGHTADELLSQVDLVTGQLLPRFQVAIVRDSLESALGTSAPVFVSGMVCSLADKVLENGRWLTLEEIQGVAVEELATLGLSEFLGALFEVQDAARDLYDITVAEVPESVTDARLRLWVRCLQLSRA